MLAPLAEWGTTISTNRVHTVFSTPTVLVVASQSRWSKGECYSAALDLVQESQRFLVASRLTRRESIIRKRVLKVTHVKHFLRQATCKT